MRIGINVMGGDFAPRSVLEGVMLVHNEIPHSDRIVSIGNISIIRDFFQKNKIEERNFDLVHTEEHIAMGENPSKAYSQKPHSSIGLGFSLLRKGEIEGFASAGNTGVMLVGAMFTSKSIPGIIRPCIAATIPSVDGLPVSSLMLA